MELRVFRCLECGYTINSLVEPRGCPNCKRPLTEIVQGAQPSGRIRIVLEVPDWVIPLLTNLPKQLKQDLGIESIRTLNQENHDEGR